MRYSSQLNHLCLWSLWGILHQDTLSKIALNLILMIMRVLVSMAISMCLIYSHNHTRTRATGCQTSRDKARTLWMVHAWCLVCSKPPHILRNHSLSSQDPPASRWPTGQKSSDLPLTIESALQLWSRGHHWTSRENCHHSRRLWSLGWKVSADRRWPH